MKVIRVEIFYLDLFETGKYDRVRNQTDHVLNTTVLAGLVLMLNL